MLLNMLVLLDSILQMQLFQINQSEDSSKIIIMSNITLISLLSPQSLVWAWSWCRYTSYPLQPSPSDVDYLWDWGMRIKATLLDLVLGSQLIIQICFCYKVLEFHLSCMLWMNIRPVYFSFIPGLSPCSLPTEFMFVCVTGHTEHCRRWTCLIYKYINFSLSHKAGPCLEQSADLGPEHLPKLIKLSEEIWI